MTCKDCVHDDVCEHWKNSVFGSDALYPKENDCEHFKNKADYVEVVRCKDCKHYWSYKSIGGFYNCKCTFDPEYDTPVHEMHFCGYGERKQKNDFKG